MLERRIGDSEPVALPTEIEVHIKDFVSSVREDIVFIGQNDNFKLLLTP